MATQESTLPEPDKEVPCDRCGAKNRIAAASTGLPHCGRCHSPLLWVVEANDSTVGEALDVATIPVLVDVWAPWCRHSRHVSRVLEGLAREHAGRLKLVEINVNESRRVARLFDVQAVPTLLLLQEGTLLARRAGPAPSLALRSWLEGALAAG